MTQETIYLCYEADKWISRESKELAYIGTDLEDCISKMAHEFELNERNKEQLRTNRQTISEDGYGYIIEEERTNCFVNGFYLVNTH